MQSSSIQGFPQFQVVLHLAYQHLLGLGLRPLARPMAAVFGASQDRKALTLKMPRQDRTVYDG